MEYQDTEIPSYEEQSVYWNDILRLMEECQWVSISKMTNGKVNLSCLRHGAKRPFHTGCLVKDFDFEKRLLACLDRAEAAFG